MTEEKPLKNYEMICPPYGTDYEDWDSKTAETHFAWFMSIIPERIEMLEKVVRSNPPEVEIAFDFSPESLEPLNQWLRENCHKRQKTEEEIQEAIGNVTGPLANNAREIIGTWDLSYQTLSLAYDIGMYLGEVTRRQSLDKLKWERMKKYKNDVDYNQPVLIWDGWENFNPVAATEVLQYGRLRRPDETNRSLKKIAEKWVAKLTANDV